MGGANGRSAEAVLTRPGPGDLTYVVAPEGGPVGPALSVLLESLLFVAHEPVAVADLARALEVERRAVERALAELAEDCAGRGVRLQRTGDRVQLVTAPEAAEAVSRFLGLAASGRLSRAALEVLSIVAYRQPVTRPEIDELRAVSSEAALRTLIGRGLVEAVGRRETVGHPVEYGTTFQFLEYFGLASLAELPPEASLSEREREPASATVGDEAVEDADSEAGRGG
jgi:segregation and condensation protein B